MGLRPGQAHALFRREHVGALVFPALGGQRIDRLFDSERKPRLGCLDPLGLDTLGRGWNHLVFIHTHRLTSEPGSIALFGRQGVCPAPGSQPQLCRDDLVDCRRLALPPVAFITWPTNQPASLGFCWAFSTCAGLAAMISSTACSIAPVSVTCFMPRASTISAGSPPSVYTISNRSLAILPEMSPFLIRPMIPASCAGETGLSPMSWSSFFSRPNSSLMTQLAASLPSPHPATTSSK